MKRRLEVDLCVIGAGSGGLSVAAGASQLGQKVVLVERGHMGGDCLNFGCVPSKALLAAAHAAHAARRAGRLGVQVDGVRADMHAVREHIRGVIAAIAPNDSVARFEGLGVTVINAHARFVGRDEIEAGDATIRARRFVIATGSTPAVPPIPGLADLPFLTNETVFELDRTPERLVVIGGGPIGCEIAQAHARLGAAVELVEARTILPKDDPELAAFVRRSLAADGVAIHEGATVARVDGAAGGFRVVVNGPQGELVIAGSHLLVAAGRRATVDGLDLDKAGVAFTEKGITVDAGLRSSNRRIYAVGDVAGGPQFTHVAGYHAGIVLRRALFRLPAKVDYRALPWVTFTAPELAQVGMTEATARETHGEIRLARWTLHENDRAQAERDAEGLVKIVADRRGRVLGAGIAAPHAGELIQAWGLAIQKRLTLRDMAGLIAPYPTLGEAGKRAAGAYFAPTLFSERTRRLVRFLARFG